MAYLDDPHRELPYPLLCGMRGTWHATSWLDIGAQRTILLGGGGRTQRLTVEDLWQILTGQGEGEAGPAAGPEHYAERDTDQKFAWQIDVHPRAWARRCGLHDLEAFWLYAGEDRFNGLVPMAPARSFGVRVHPTERLAASFVHVKTVDDLNFWYHHKVYVDGYSYHGVIMGHPMGGDAERWACGLFASPDGEQILSVRLVRERRGFFRDGRGLTAGGFWMWIIGVEAPGPGVQLAADLGATWAWGGDRESDRLAEGFARVSIVWPRRASLAIDRARLWGTAE